MSESISILHLHLYLYLHPLKGALSREPRAFLRTPGRGDAGAWCKEANSPGSLLETGALAEWKIDKAGFSGPLFQGTYHSSGFIQYHTFIHTYMYNISYIYTLYTSMHGRFRVIKSFLHLRVLAFFNASYAPRQA